MNLTPSTELEAINLMLFGIGESPVNSVEESGSVDAVVARATLLAVSREVQERGWHWNTLEKLSLPTTVNDGFVTLPDNTLKIDTVGPSEGLDAIQRGKRLFNKDTNSFVFDGPVTVNLVEFLAFGEIPQAARTYITLEATKRFQQSRVGSETLSSFQEKTRLTAWAALLDAEAETADRTIFDHFSVARVMAR